MHVSLAEPGKAAAVSHIGLAGSRKTFRLWLLAMSYIHACSLDSMAELERPGLWRLQYLQINTILAGANEFAIRFACVLLHTNVFVARDKPKLLYFSDVHN